METHSLTYDLGKNAWTSGVLPPLDSPRTLVMVFAAPELASRPEVLAELASHYPRSLVVGCSSAGEIHGTSVRDRSLAVTVTRFASTDLQLASVEVKGPADSHAAGVRLAKRLSARPGLRAVLILSEGLNVSGSDLIRGFNTVLDPSVVVTGGLSADGADFKRTWVIIGSQLVSNMAVAVGLYGDDLVVGHGSQGGWDKFGPERSVTRSDGNVLYELDGRPALQLYKEYLGEKAKDLPSSGLLFPLALRASGDADKAIVRTLLAVNHEQQSLTFAGDIPQGTQAQLMKADFDRLIGGAGTAAVRAGQPTVQDPDRNALVIAISCVGRRLVLGARTEEEVEAVSEALALPQAHITGFYSYGEISPYTTGHCDLHNQTMTLTVLSEAPPGAPRAARGSAPHRAVDGDTAVEALRVATPAPSAAEFAVSQLAYDVPARSWSAPFPDLDSPRTLVLGFGASSLFDSAEVFAELTRAYPRSVVIGCSTAGEIHGNTVRDQSLAVTVTRFAATDLQMVAFAVKSTADSRSAGARLAQRLAARPGLRGVLVLSEGVNVNGSELVTGINSVLPAEVVVTGGLSGDGANFKRTWVAIGDKVRSNVVAAVGFYGDRVVLGHGSKGGWDKFGPERRVTKSVSNVLHELDGRPALTLYKEYLGDKAKDLPAAGLLFPLALRAGADADKVVVRTLLAVDHQRNTLTLAGDVPEGSLVQLMRADFDRLIQGAGTAGQMASTTLNAPVGADSLIIAISCVGRRLVLGARTEEEIEAVEESLPPTRAVVTGFYSYGEISPFATGHCDLHNQTMTLTVISEAPASLARPAPPARPSRPSAALQAAMLGAAPVPASTGATARRSGLIPVPAAAARAEGTPAPRGSSPTVPHRSAPPPAPPSAPPVAARVAPDAPGPTRPSTAAPARPAPQAGPSVRVPRPVAQDAISEVTVRGDLQVVTIRGRINETFKGDTLGRTLRGRVAFDLADVDRVTSFGVREWLAMLAARTHVSETFLLRCSESVANQLGLIRKFDGGAQIVSFYAPYMCGGCGSQLERLFDREHDADELREGAPRPVSCPRCQAEAVFDDDPRSYFGFAAAASAVAVPADVRALARELGAAPAAAVIDDVEKTVDGDLTRVRVHARLSSQLRWNRVLDGLEGSLVIDLSDIPASDATGIGNLEQALRSLPPEVSPVEVEAAPLPLVERILQGGSRRVRVVSVVVSAFCPACATHRPATLRIDQLDDSAPTATSHDVVCKRCNGQAQAALTEAVHKLIEIHRRPARSHTPIVAAAPALEPAAQAPAAPAPRRRLGAGAIAVAISLLGAAGAVGLSMWRRPSPSGTTAVSASTAVSPSVAGTGSAQVPAPPPASTDPAGPGGSPAAVGAWTSGDSLPPAWAERPVALAPDRALVIGNGAGAGTVEAALVMARADATMRLLDQLTQALDGTRLQAFLAPRLRREDASASARVVERFNRQHGTDVAFERVDVSTRQTATGFEAIARYSMPRAQYDQLVAHYRATSRLYGLEVAPFFPLLETAFHGGGDLVVVTVERRSPAEAAGVREGDVVTGLGAGEVRTVAEFRDVASQLRRDTPPGGRLRLEVESGGATRVVKLARPAQPPRE